MLVRPLIFFFSLLLCCRCLAQTDHKKSNTEIKSNTEVKSKAKQKEVESSAKELITVLFATNEDCDLFIDGELKGQVLKSEFRYLKLLPGNYTYKSRSKATRDELTEAFTVAEGGINEIFIDLLYVVDEKNLQRQNSLVKNNPPLQPVILSQNMPGDNQPEIKRSIANKDALIATVNSLVGNMVLIKSGSFVMGNNKAPVADEVEHPVTINPVLFSKYEVTQYQWETVMGYNPSLNKGCSTCPVENVSWEEVMKFIRRLDVLSNKKFRLPTEAEWEYVARIGGKLEVDTAGGPEAYIKKTAWYFANSDKRTHPVGIRQPNAAGVFDLMGNVSEWCLDWYGAYYYKEDFNQLNPEGPPLGKEKIIRGGNFKDYVADRFRPSMRNKRNPIEKSSEVGFRLVLEQY